MPEELINSDSEQINQDELLYQSEVNRNLKRNFIAHLCHGLLGQTGFRLVNAPTFIPAYVLMLSFIMMIDQPDKFDFHSRLSQYISFTSKLKNSI